MRYRIQINASCGKIRGDHKRIQRLLDAAHRLLAFSAFHIAMEFRDIEFLFPESFCDLMCFISRIGKDQADIRLDSRENGTDGLKIRMVIARYQDMADLRIQTCFFSDSDRHRFMHVFADEWLQLIRHRRGE